MGQDIDGDSTSSEMFDDSSEDEWDCEYDGENVIQRKDIFKNNKRVKIIIDEEWETWNPED